MTKITPVLLSGGTGSRLWPLSREALPKQLLPLLGEETLLQQTARRVLHPTLFGELLVIPNAEHRFIVAEQLRAIGASDGLIILEPRGRNTAPAAAVAASPHSGTRTACCFSCRPITPSQTCRLSRALWRSG